MAFGKGQFVTSTDWIGATFHIEPSGVSATIQAARIDELRSLVSMLLSKNAVSVKDLRSFTGKAQSMASLLYTWRPFVYMFYAAVQADELGGAPVGCRWVR